MKTTLTTILYLGASAVLLTHSTDLVHILGAVALLTIPFADRVNTSTK